MRVRWVDLGSEIYEEMVSVLINTLHPGAQRIDGKGGDGGKDVQIPTPEGLQVFQLKGFTGRVTERPLGRRTQIRRSMEALASSAPAEVFIVVPIDLNEVERRWFDGLTAKYPFPIRWLGKTWLDSQMGQHPAIPRYFLADGSQELVDLIRELRLEEAAIDTVQRAGERMRALAARLAEADPFYVYDVRATPTSTHVEARPAYKGAELDRPIGISLEASFPDTPEGRQKSQEFTSAFAFGTSVTLPPENIIKIEVDAPLPLGAPLKDATVTIGGADDPWTARGMMRVTGVDGRILAGLPVKLDDRRRGTDGVTFRVRDASEALTGRFTIDAAGGRGNMSFSFRPSAEVTPGMVVPALQFLEVLCSPNILGLEIDDPMVELPFPLLDRPQPLVPSGFVRLVEALLRVQTATRTTFPLPDDFTKEDLDAISRADRLTRGQRVKVNWVDCPIVVAGHAARTVALQCPARLALFMPDRMERLCGRDISLGAARLILESCDLSDRDTWLSHESTSDDDVELRLIPSSTDVAEWELTAPDDIQRAHP